MGLKKLIAECRRGLDRAECVLDKNKFNACYCQLQVLRNLLIDELKKKRSKKNVK